MCRSLLFFCFLTSIVYVQGQSVQERTFFNLSYQNNQHGSTIGVPFENMLSFESASFRISFEDYLSKSLNLTTSALFGEVSHSEQNNSKLLGFDANLKFKLNNGIILPESSRLTPYISLGVGLLNFKNRPNERENGTQINISPEVGIDYRISKGSKVFISTAHKLNNTMRYRELSLGYGFSIKSRDKDNDGIPNSKDSCPNEAGLIGNNGCPYPDSDGDGIIDAEDLCPNIPGDLRGCPDTDNDGVTNAKDQCPDEPGENNGCPKVVDTDHDGIPDSEDSCPDQAGTLNGCPEGTVKNLPVDTDNDGIPDDLDECPTSKVCPTVIIPELPVDLVLFESNSAEILSKYEHQLDQMAALMTQHNFKLELRGYTDMTGDELYNSGLSKSRVDVIKDYLVSKGVSTDRISTKSFGVLFPIANNDTENGRALNRRTELRILPD